MKAVYYLLANALQTAFILIWSVFWMPLAALLATVTLRPDRALALARRCYAPGIIWAARARLEVEPLPDIDWSRPHIFLMNHQSALDIPCAFAALPVNLRFIAKHTLAYVPLLGWYMWATGMIFINRSSRHGAVQSLARAGERIRAGANIIAYPEGTRSIDGKVLPFKKGPFLLALAAGVPVVPVAIEGSGRVLPTGGLHFRPGVVRMKVGQPIETAHLNPKNRDVLLAQVRDAIIELQESIGGSGGDPQAIAALGVEGRGPPATERGKLEVAREVR